VALLRKPRCIALPAQSRYNPAMEADFVNTPEAFAEANEKARREYLRSLTLEKAAEDLERILNGWVEIRDSIEGLDLPPLRPKPFPDVWLSIILEGKPSPEE
jgi:hypothetical protein